MSNETELKNFLKAEAAARRRGAKMLLVAGIILAVVLVVWFGYVYRRLSTELKAQDIIDIAFSKVPAAQDLAPRVEQWVMNQAPGLMDQAKDAIVENLPKLRERAEELAGTYADILANRIYETSNQQIEEIILTHGEAVRRALAAIGDIEKSATAKEDLKKALAEEFEKVAVRELDPYLPGFLEALQDMEVELTLLVDTPSEQLTEEQRLEKELLHLVFELCTRAYERVGG